MKNIFIQITKQLMGLKVWYNISFKNPTLNYWLYVPKYSWQISAKELIKIIHHKNKQWYVEHKSMSMSFYEDKFHNIPLNHNQYKKLWGKNLFTDPIPFSNITLPLCTIYMQLLFLVEWHDIVGCLMCYMFFWWRLLWLFLLLNQIFVPEAYYLQCKITLKIYHENVLCLLLDNELYIELVFAHHPRFLLVPHLYAWMITPYQ